MSSTVDYVISSEQREQYREEGYFILEGVVPDHHLTMLREECQHYIEKEDAELSRREDNQRGITHMGKR